MNRADRQRWASARDLADLGELTALWCTGDIGETPGHCGGPDAETRPYLRILAAANRRGFVTENSQAAGPSWGAEVCGWARPSTLNRLSDTIGSSRLIVSPLSRGTVREIAGWYRRYCHRDAVASLKAARFVLIVDPAANRNDLLWPTLARFAGLAIRED